jgi:hypothetical protein
MYFIFEIFIDNLYFIKHKTTVSLHGLSVSRPDSNFALNLNTSVPDQKMWYHRELCRNICHTFSFEAAFSSRFLCLRLTFIDFWKFNLSNSFVMNVSPTANQVSRRKFTTVPLCNLLLISSLIDAKRFFVGRFSGRHKETRSFPVLSNVLEVFLSHRSDLFYILLKGHKHTGLHSFTSVNF